MRWEIAAPITTLITYRAYSHGSLTPTGCLAAAATATVHALHPSPLPFILLLVFFTIGTAATKMKKEVKATLTLPSTGSHARTPSSAIGDVFSGGWNKNNPNEKQKARAESAASGQEPRSAIQVFANSGCVTLLCLVQVWIYGDDTSEKCFGAGGARDLILVGIIANYAAVMADTLSSELGILSPYKPRFILTLKEVPAGTNGGVTGYGFASGLVGALLVGAVSVLTLPRICNGGLEDHVGLVLLIGGWGALGSVLDSILGAILQASVVDRRSGKIVEAPNGGRVLYVKEKAESDGKPSRMLESGRDILDNNGVNILMAVVMTVGGIIGASHVLESPLSSLWMKI